MLYSFKIQLQNLLCARTPPYCTQTISQKTIETMQGNKLTNNQLFYTCARRQTFVEHNFIIFKIKTIQKIHLFYLFIFPSTLPRNNNQKICPPLMMVAVNTVPSQVWQVPARISPC